MIYEPMAAPFLRTTDSWPLVKVSAENFLTLFVLRFCDCYPKEVGIAGSFYFLACRYENQFFHLWKRVEQKNALRTKSLAQGAR